MFRSLKILIIILIFSAAESGAQSVKTDVTIDTNDVLIGDWIHLYLKVEADSSINYFLPQVADTLNGLEIVDRTIPDTSLSGMNRIIRQKFTLTSFDSGNFVFPSLEIIERLDDQDSIKYHFTTPMELRFGTVEVDTAEAIKDIKAPLTAPWTFEEILPYILYGVLVLLLVGIGYYFWKKRKPKEPEHLKYDPKIPAHILALEGLNNLFEQNLWQKGEIKRYHIVLTEIIRLYIERRFNIPALEMVSNDIINDLKAKELDEELINKLRFIFSIADLVKFAKSQPIADENSKSMDYAVEFVKATIPSDSDRETESTKEGNDG